MSHSKIDKALKKALENWEVPVEKAHWEGISANINSNPPQKKRSYWLWMIASLMVIGTVAWGITEFFPTSGKTMSDAGGKGILKDELSPNLGAPEKILANNSIQSDFVSKKATYIKAGTSKDERDQPARASNNYKSYDSPIQEVEKNNMEEASFLERKPFIFAHMFLPDAIQSQLSEVKWIGNDLATRPRPTTPSMQNRLEWVVSAGYGYTKETVSKTQTNSLTHRDYATVWNGAKTLGANFNFKLLCFQPFSSRSRMGWSGGFSYIKSFENTAYNYIYKDVPVVDLSSNQIVGYVKLSPTTQKAVGAGYADNTEFTMLSQLYYNIYRAKLIEMRMIFGASYNLFAKSYGNFYDIDKSELVSGSRKVNGIFNPEWGVSTRLYLGKRNTLHVGYQGRILGWKLDQSKGSVTSNSLQQNIQIGWGIIF